MADGSVLIVGGTGGLGRELASRDQSQGFPVVLTGRDADRCSQMAGEIGPGGTGIGFDLAQPHTIAEALADVSPVSRLVLSAIDRDGNPIRTYDSDGAIDLTTTKLVRYTETIHGFAQSSFR